MSSDKKITKSDQVKVNNGKYILNKGNGEKSPNQSDEEIIKMAVEETSSVTQEIKKQSNENDQLRDIDGSKEETSVTNKPFYLSENDRNRLIKNFKILNKDLYLKLFGKILYNKKKYFCELECKIFDDSYYKYYKKEEISDIDVLGIKFEEDLTCIKVGLECKSTTREGVDEILKLKGTQEYVGLNFAGLLKKRVSNNVRLVANKLNIELYDEAEIQRKVEKLVPNLQEKVQIESAMYSLQMSIENEIKAKIRGVISYIKSDYWTNEPYQNINTLVRALEHIRENKEFALYQQRYLLIRLSILLSLSFLQIVSFIVRSNYSQANQVALDQLFGGAALRREKERTFDLISQEIGKKMHPYPYFTEDYLNIINWYIGELEAASLVPLCLEEILKCFLLGTNPKTINNNYSEYTIKLAKDIIRFTSKIYKDPDILKAIYEI